MTVADDSVTTPTPGPQDSVHEHQNVDTERNPRHPESIVDVLSARCSSEALAYVFLENGTDSEIRWTFVDTARNSRRFASHLHDRGIGAGDRVVLAVNPTLEYVAALYGIMQLGAIPVPCFPPLRAKELDRFHAITVDCAPAGIVIDEMYRETIAELQKRLKSADLEPVIVYAEHAAGGADEVDPVSRTANDTALIQYTSGSTGSPKGVCLTHDNLMSNCEALGRSMGHDPDRVGLTWLPPYHDMGLMGTIMLSLYHGWPLVMMSPMHFIQSPLRWLKAITDYRVTITVGPNFSLDVCSDALSDNDTTDLDLSTVKELYCGAEPISTDTLARFEQITAPLGFDGRALIPCYGMAEATLFVAGKRRDTVYRADCPPEPSAADRAVVSCGEVDSEHVVRIVDTTTHKSLDDGLIGEIWVSGRSVAAGYYNRTTLTREVFHARLADEDSEYLRTGDLGFIRSGELFVTGRIKDLIIVNGRNIYPQDVETAVRRANPVFQVAAAFSIPGNSSEQLCVVAEVGHREVSAELYSEMIEAIRFDVTSEFGIRPHVHIGPKRTIPTTTSGKVRRRETKRMFLANELRCLQIDPVTAQECTA
jgi:acyl-CoA synthetase (AMP-forming)/AMP-acid ligase II